MISHLWILFVWKTFKWKGHESVHCGFWIVSTECISVLYTGFESCLCLYKEHHHQLNYSSSEWIFLKHTEIIIKIVQLEEVFVIFYDKIRCTEYQLAFSPHCMKTCDSLPMMISDALYRCWFSWLGSFIDRSCTVCRIRCSQLLDRFALTKDWCTTVVSLDVLIGHQWYKKIL